MGPMGPMGPMMGGPWGSGTAGWPVLALMVVLVLALGLIALAVLGIGVQRRRPRSPEEILRERYTRGEISRQEYLDALADVLKDRYIRSELTFDEYEERLGLLLEAPLRGSRPELAQRGQITTRR